MKLDYLALSKDTYCLGAVDIFIGLDMIWKILFLPGWLAERCVDYGNMFIAAGSIQLFSVPAMILTAIVYRYQYKDTKTFYRDIS